MFNESLFLKENGSSSRRKILMTNQKTYVYRSSSRTIDLCEIKRILMFLDSIKKKHALSLLPVIIDLGEQAIIEDKLTYILLSCICHNLITNERCRLILNFSFPKNIFNDGVENSYLKYVNGTREGYDIFLKHFNFNIQRKHYRRVLTSEGFDGSQTAKTVQEMDSFLQHCFIPPDYCDRISNIVGELIDNSLDHSQSDCLVDIDVTSDYVKKHSGPSQHIYYGVNIVVLNFSDILIGDGVSQKLKLVSLNPESPSIHQRYRDVLSAYAYHSQKWSDEYNEDDFNIIASFQYKISSRPSCVTGGTGLTQLIRGLEDKSDEYECYLLSGTKKLRFIRDCLVYDDNEWVGFNNTGNFLTDIPSNRCIGKSGLFFPGTAYNFNFVIKSEVDAQ